MHNLELLLNTNKYVAHYDAYSVGGVCVYRRKSRSSRLDALYNFVLAPNVSFSFLLVSIFVSGSFCSIHFLHICTFGVCNVLIIPSIWCVCVCLRLWCSAHSFWPLVDKHNYLGDGIITHSFFNIHLDFILFNIDRYANESRSTDCVCVSVWICECEFLHDMRNECCSLYL